MSGVSVEVPQSGVDKVDLLFMIDNSGSMSEEQAKLASVLDDMVRILVTGQQDPTMPKPKPDFPPVQSLHIGVVSSDMGVNGAQPQKSCGALSFKPDERDTQNAMEFLVKPLGDDGILQTSTVVATNGIFVAPTPGAMPVVKVPGDPACASVSFPPGERYINFISGMTDAEQTATKFGCIAKLGKNGCGLEQQLESVLKGLTPPDNPNIKFSGSATNGQPTSGQGNAINMNAVSGPNRGFLREDSILAVVFVTDEEDCSIPDASRAIFDAADTSIPGEINVRCGLPQNQGKLHPVKRYVDGLRALKPAAYQDRIIVASVVGVPTKDTLGGTGVTSGEAQIQAILDRPDMQFKVQRNAAGNADEPVPTCISSTGDGAAAPARRFLELTKEFKENGVVTSICEASYGPALQVIINKIAAQLTGACLPRKLNADANGKVLCDVVEIKAAGSQVQCDPNKGREKELPPRNGRRVCLMKQVPGGNGGEGWYYDESSDEVLKQCAKNPQRIAFTGAANPDPGSQAKFECFQPVAKAVNEMVDQDEEAVGLTCREVPGSTGLSGDAKCDMQESQTGGVDLICILGTCQQACARQSDCPDGWLCETNPVDNRNFCINPTCPPSLN